MTDNTMNRVYVEDLLRRKDEDIAFLRSRLAKAEVEWATRDADLAALRERLAAAEGGGAFHLGKGLVASGTGTTADGTPVVWLRAVKAGGKVGADCTVENHEDVGVDLVIHDPAGARVLIEDLQKAAGIPSAEALVRELAAVARAAEKYVGSFQEEDALETGRWYAVVVSALAALSDESRKEIERDPR